MQHWGKRKRLNLATISVNQLTDPIPYNKLCSWYFLISKIWENVGDFRIRKKRGRERKEQMKTPWSYIIPKAFCITPCHVSMHN